MVVMNYNEWLLITKIYKKKTKNFDEFRKN